MKKFLLIVFIAVISFGKVEAQVNVGDSLALVDLYNSTGGANWNNHTNWLTTLPLSGWHGVKVKNERVIKLALFGENMQGIIPASIGTLTHLTRLVFFNNKITGEIPESLGNLKNLTYLDLSINDFGKIPASLGNLSKLTYVDISYNHLQGNIPASLGNLKSLKELYLQDNQLNGTIPSELGNLFSLLKMNLGSNNLSGNIPASLGNLSNQTTISLGYNQLSGTIPPSLGNLGGVGLSYNQLTGTIPASLEKLPSGFALDNNLLTGSIPDSFTTVSKMYELHLENNNLTGSIPASLGNLQHLSQLYLNNNQLSGSIPSSLGNCPDLLYIYLYNNQLTRSIPVSLFLLPSFVIDLSNNQISGSIPQFIDPISGMKTHSRIRELHLEQNQLTGDLSALDSAIELNTCDVSHNFLSGYITTFPTQRQQGFHQIQLDISYNKYRFNPLEQAIPQLKTITTAYFTYSPQTEIPLHYANSKFSVTAGGTLSNDTFRLYKNGLLIKTQGGDSVFTSTGAGNYFMTVTNKIATQLTLHSDTVTLTEPIAENISVTKTFNSYIYLYPNPAKDKLSVVINALQNEAVQIDVVDMQGKVLLLTNKNISTGTSTQSINISALAKGNYFVRIKTNGAATTLKFVKE